VQIAFATSPQRRPVRQAPYDWRVVRADDVRGWVRMRVRVPVISRARPRKAAVNRLEAWDSFEFW
jgi:hypothetical protein